MLKRDLVDLKYQYYTLLYGGLVPSLVSCYFSVIIVTVDFKPVGLLNSDLVDLKYQYYTLLYGRLVPSLVSCYVYCFCSY
jgi:hypothetical protein